MSERRKTPRRTVDLLGNRYNRGAARPVRVSDVSHGGLRVECDDLVTMAGMVSVELDLPGRSPVWMFCRATRHEAGGVGLAIVCMDDRDEAAFASYLAELPAC